MYTNVLLPRRMPRFACLCRTASSIEGQKLPQKSAASDGISPPPRIPRSPTDILQALAATVGPDPTAAHYKYHDDPYLIPLSNFRKRSYALSAEAGRKAAAWIRDEHAELFATRIWDPPLRMKTPYFNADPHIAAFTPRPIYNDESKVTEDDLKYTLKNALVEDSIKVFQLLGGTKGVNEKLKIEFLQLLCFYNEKEPDSAEWLEERWFSANTRERQAATWRLGGLADQIFNSLEPKTPEVYCAVIQGMAKYYQAERAHALAQEALEKGITLSTNVYNALLGCVGFLREGTALRIDALKSLLNEMNEQGLTPNDETLTACLRSVSAWGGGKMLQDFALQIVAEFRQLGIQPGLSAYYYLLCLFCKERGPRVDILTAVLNDLENRENLQAKEPTDTNFFITAMGVCSDHLQVHFTSYINFGSWFRHAPFERTTHLLDTLVPNIYVPEPSVMEEIIKTLEVGGAGDRLAQAWSQLVVFGHAKRAKLVEKILAAMVSCYQYQDDEVKTKMRTAAMDILKFGQIVEEQQDARDVRAPMQLRISAAGLTNIIELCSDAQDKADQAWDSVAEALQRLRRDEAVGVPHNPQVLANVANKSAAIGKQDIATMAVAYLAECGFEEAATASVQTLGVMLNRSEEEVHALLQQPRSELETSLHPAALAIVEAYQVTKTGAPVRDADSTTSSSDSESSSDDE
ncbi:protein PTCD3 homolog, mitochondrial [Hyposmocoma kahamanoa]|uniref:protein PTCD3 homolog, mitochondrial n=1 Tax=Hyposmocoma kahamanoa TaxID=1477025 RepID=UPI000E6D79AB|nr:protein PTCD3 homolog, mitochondrial [Hyposmocoma kahamanoa]